MKQLADIFVSNANEALRSRDDAEKRRTASNEEKCYLIDNKCMSFLYLMEEIESAVSDNSSGMRFRFRFEQKDAFSFRIQACYEDIRNPYEIEEIVSQKNSSGTREVIAFSMTNYRSQPEFSFTRYDEMTYKRGRSAYEGGSARGEYIWFEAFAKWAGKTMPEHKNSIATILKKYQTHYRPPEEKPQEPPARKKRFGLF